MMDLSEIFSKEMLTVSFTLFAVIDIIGAVPVQVLRNIMIYQYSDKVNNI